MAMDSIIARPTNKVRVMVLAASGCCASELKAVETARPSPSAGAMLPSAMVTPAVMMEMIAIRVVPSMMCPFVADGLGSCCAGSRGGCDVNGGEDAENVGLNHAGEQTEQVHEVRENERRNREQDADNHRSAHDVAEQTDGQCKRARE